MAMGAGPPTFYAVGFGLEAQGSSKGHVSFGINIIARLGVSWDIQQTRE